VPSLSPTWLSSSAPPKNRALSLSLSAAASHLLVVWILEDEEGWGRCSCPGGKADTFLPGPVAGRPMIRSLGLGERAENDGDLSRADESRLSSWW